MRRPLGWMAAAMLVAASITVPASVGTGAAAVTCSVAWPTAIGAGLSHTLFLSGADVFASGQNGYGQLGYGITGGNTGSPERVAPLPSAAAVASGASHSLAIVTSGSTTAVEAWGANGAGQLGNGTTTASNVPVAVQGLSGIRTVAAGGNFSLALLYDGTLWAWGDNASGQLGNGTTTASSVPVQVQAPAGRTITAIAAAAELQWSSSHALALMSDGSVWSWGSNRSGQLGYAGSDTPVPTRVAGLPPVVAVAAGGEHSMAVDSAGTVWAWGHNNAGELATGTADQGRHTTPAQAKAPTGVLTGVTAVAAGALHSLALRSDGTVWAWGRNQEGQLGNGTNIQSNFALQVGSATAPLTGATSITAGGYDSFALRSPGRPAVWGRGTYGELGGQATVNTPTDMPCIPPPCNGSGASECPFYIEDGMSHRIGVWYTTRQPAAPRPAVLFIHEGAWQGGSYADGGLVDVVNDMSSQFPGWIEFSMNYTLDAPPPSTPPATPPPPKPRAVQDGEVRAALSWIAQNAGAYNIDISRVGLFGGSAGAHLSMLAGAQTTGPGSPIVPAVVGEWSGPTDMAKLVAEQQPPPNGCSNVMCNPTTQLAGAAVQNFEGECLSEQPAPGPNLQYCGDTRYTDTSPALKVSAVYPPTFLAQAVDDIVVNSKQEDHMVQALRTLGVTYNALIVYDPDLGESPGGDPNTIYIADTKTVSYGRDEGKPREPIDHSYSYPSALRCFATGPTLEFMRRYLDPSHAPIPATFTTSIGC